LSGDTKITFLGGVNEVGGNKILLTDKDTSILLDFGKGFSRRAKYFDDYLSPRTANGLVDFGGDDRILGNGGSITSAAVMEMICSLVVLATIFYYWSV
jgi:hypothetical protein